MVAQGQTLSLSRGDLKCGITQSQVRGHMLGCKAFAQKRSALVLQRRTLSAFRIGHGSATLHHVTSEPDRIFSLINHFVY